MDFYLNSRPNASPKTIASRRPNHLAIAVGSANWRGTAASKIRLRFDGRSWAADRMQNESHYLHPDSIPGCFQRLRCGAKSANGGWDDQRHRTFSSDPLAVAAKGAASCRQEKGVLGVSVALG